MRPDEQQIALADYGSYPQNYEQTIKDYLYPILIDPKSTDYRFVRTPTKAWNGWGGTKFGYAVCVYVNSKNRFGGYTGAKMNYFLIKNDVVLSHLFGISGDAGCTS